MSIQARDLNGDLNYVAGLSNVDMILSPTSKSAIANKTVYNALATKIESTVENLVNFYNKSQVYNKQEVRELIGAINTLTIEVVNELPTQDISATTIYFLKQSGANTYDEYIYVDNAWVKIGDTDIDLSGYLTIANFQIAIADYYTKSAIDAMIANYYTKTQVDAMVDAKQDELTFDNVPTAGSDNPVKSGGIKTALDAKQNTLTFDSTPTASSSNPVTSDGIKDAIDDTATDIYEVMGKNGAKNLISYPYSDTTKTANGVTFTDLGDGTVKVNGTATATALFTLAGLNKQVLKAGTYILSGCPDVSAGAYIQVYANGSGTTIAKDRYENEPGGVRFTLTQEQVDANNIMIGIAVLKDTQVSNAIFKPMIRLASDADSTYQPYAMTNKELTQPEVKVLTLDSRYTSAGVVYYVKVGRVVIVSLETVVLTSSATNSTPICTLPIPIARSNNTKIRACGWTTTKSVALIEVDATSGALTFGGTIPSTSEGIFGQIVYIS